MKLVHETYDEWWEQEGGEPKPFTVPEVRIRVDVEQFVATLNELSKQIDGVLEFYRVYRRIVSRTHKQYRQKRKGRW